MSTKYTVQVTADGDAGTFNAATFILENRTVLTEGRMMRECLASIFGQILCTITNEMGNAALSFTTLRLLDVIEDIHDEAHDKAES